MAAKKMIIKPKIDEKQLHSNPLVTDSFLILVRNVKEKMFLLDEEGDLVPHTTLMEIDRSTKVYQQPDYRKLISYLSAPAQRLFIWILYEAEAGKDWLWINKERYMMENNIKSPTTYKAGISELCTHLIISPTIYKNTYWINPRVFFCGSRTKKYRSHVREWEDRDKNE